MSEPEHTESTPEPQASISFYVPERVKKQTKILAIQRGSTLWATSKDCFMIGFEILMQSQADQEEEENTKGTE
jgi:hypothetical protein